MRNMQKRSAVVLGLLCLLFADVATAGDYKIIHGKGEELCEVCLKNLLQQSAEEAVCDRQYRADLGLSTPEWKPLDLREQAALYKRVANLIDRGNEEFKDPELGDSKQREEFLRVMSQTRSAMSIASIDVDNDGNLNQVLRYHSGNCKKMFHGFHGFYQSALLVLAADQRTIDYAKTDPLVQHSFFMDAKYRAKYRIGIPHFQLYQVFTYRGTVYFDKWDGGGGQGGSGHARACPTR